MTLDLRDRVGVHDLWARYATERTPTLRDQLTVHYSPLVKWVASRLGAGLPHKVEQADLIGYGMFGLLDAIDKFEVERGYKFETYAVSRIRGAIIDGLRASDWVPRSVRSKARALENAITRLEAELHRSPTDAELADELGISRVHLQQLLSDISSAGALVGLDESLSRDGDEEAATLGDTLTDGVDGPEELFERNEMRRLLAATIAKLPEREKIVLTLYYYERMTLREIGEVLGVTESRVSQIHTKAVVHLRSRLAVAQREGASAGRCVGAPRVVLAAETTT